MCCWWCETLEYENKSHFHKSWYILFEHQLRSVLTKYARPLERLGWGGQSRAFAGDGLAVVCSASGGVERRTGHGRTSKRSGPPASKARALVLVLPASTPTSAGSVRTPTPGDAASATGSFDCRRVKPLSTTPSPSFYNSQGQPPCTTLFINPGHRQYVWPGVRPTGFINCCSTAPALWLVLLNSTVRPTAGGA